MCLTGCQQLSDRQRLRHCAVRQHHCCEKLAVDAAPKMLRQAAESHCSLDHSPYILSVMLNDRPKPRGRVQDYEVEAEAEAKNNYRTRKPSYRWQTRATRKPAKNSTCLQRCSWQYWPIFIRLAVVASEICEIARNSLKIQTYGVQGHPRSSILVSMESPYMTSY